MSAGNKVLRDIVTDLEAVLNKCGVMYHVFYRTKSEMSIKNAEFNLQMQQNSD